MKSKAWIRAAVIIGIALLLIALPLLGACAGKEEAVPTPIPTPAPTPTPTPTPKQVEASDGRVTIILDKVERADVLPPDIVEALSAGKSPTPIEGCDFVCVYLTIARIENVHMVNPLGYGDERPALLDAEGHQYKLEDGQVRGIKYLDPHDIRSPCEAVEGATGFLVFEVPKHERPAKLSFVYSFKETWEEESAKRGQIDIILCL